MIVSYCIMFNNAVINTFKLHHSFMKGFHSYIERQSERYR